MPRYWMNHWWVRQGVPSYCWADSLEQAKECITAYAQLLDVFVPPNSFYHAHEAHSQDPIGAGEKRKFEPDFRTNKDA